MSLRRGIFKREQHHENEVEVDDNSMQQALGSKKNLALSAGLTRGVVGGAGHSALRPRRGTNQGGPDLATHRRLDGLRQGPLRPMRCSALRWPTNIPRIVIDPSKADGSQAVADRIAAGVLLRMSVGFHLKFISHNDMIFNLWHSSR